MTAASAVNSPTTLGAMNCTSTAATAPKPSVMPMPYRSVADARSWRPAPTSCAPSADTVESIDDGTRNTKLMNFSTTPTAAASVRPRRLAMTVMIKNEIWIKPSCMATGTPTRRMRPMMARRGRKSLFCSCTPSSPRFKIAASETTTLMAWDSVVPSAAPTGPMPSAPIKTRSSTMLAAQATAIKYIGLLESPSPR